MYDLCLTQDYEISLADRDRLKDKYEGDLRKMQVLKALFSRALAIGFENNRFAERHNESSQGESRIDERKRGFGELDIREKEMLVGKVLQPIENQLEVNLQ